MKQSVVVLYAKDYDIPPADGRDGVKGTTVMYYFTDAFKAKVGNSDGSKGLRPVKGNLPFEMMAKIPKAPAVYEAEMDFKIGSDYKPVMSIVDLKYITDFSLLTPDGEVLGSGSMEEEKK